MNQGSMGSMCSQYTELWLSPVSACLLAPVSRPELTPHLAQPDLLETATINKFFYKQHTNALQASSFQQATIL